MKRSSGILMPITALPSPYGIGTLGKAAYQFADFLCTSGQSYWQILPIGHTGYGDSPYQAFSAFAGNPYFIDLDTLIEEQLLTKEEVSHLETQPVQAIDYGQLFTERYPLLRCAFSRVQNKEKEKIEVFREKQKAWLEDYALYMAIKTDKKGAGWLTWEAELRERDTTCLEKYKTRLEMERRFWVFIQYKFYEQWYKLKKYVNTLGIQIIGDLPIYVASDSCDVWASEGLFKLDEMRTPYVVAGCPPDAFSDEGQLWGNPIYDWEVMQKTGYNWWVRRIASSLKLFDWIRIDHFRGFEAYWEIPFGETTAIQGEWVKGPGIHLFNKLKEVLGELPIIAEDLGYLTQEVIDLREATGYPGMKVLQFAFNPQEESDYMPHSYPTHCVVYTGTHDNDTIRGWLETTGPKEEVAYAKQYLNLTKEEGYNWGYIRGAWGSVAVLALTTMQDLLNLGNESRMNFPSTTEGNWGWRMQSDALNQDLSHHLYQTTKMYGRLPKIS